MKKQGSNGLVILTSFIFFIWVATLRVFLKWFVFCLSLELLHACLSCVCEDLVRSIAGVNMMYLVIVCPVCPGSDSGSSGSRKAMQAASAASQQLCKHCQSSYILPMYKYLMALFSPWWVCFVCDTFLRNRSISFVW